MSAYYLVQRRACEVHVGDRIAIPDPMLVVAAPVHVGHIVVLPVRPLGTRAEGPPSALPLDRDEILVVEEFA